LVKTFFDDYVSLKEFVSILFHSVLYIFP